AHLDLHFFPTRRSSDLAMAGCADQVKMARVPVRWLKARAAFAEVDFACDAGVHHPLERSVHRRAADPGVGPAKHHNQVVRAQMTDRKSTRLNSSHVAIS